MPAPKGRSKSAKKPTPLELIQEDISKNKIKIEELTNEINLLNASIQNEGAEEKRLRTKLQVILPEIIAHRDREKFPLEPVEDLIDIDAVYIREMVYSLVDDLNGRQNKKSLIEERIDELERRVTEQYQDYQSILRKNLACMNGVETALTASSAYEMKYLLRKLKQDLLLEQPLRDHQGYSQSDLFSLTEPAFGETEPIPRASLLILQAMETTHFNLPKPARRLPGDTHIRYILPEIKQAICDELSIEKSNRGDWRHMAQLVGISTETIQFWRRLNMKNPMEQVFTFWKDSVMASVSSLHRHLMSQQVKAVILAKIVADFYHID